MIVMPFALAALMLAQTPTAVQAPARPAPPTLPQTGADSDLLEAAKLGEVARARDLIAKGARINTADWRGFTPLMWAAAGGSAEMVRQLLDGGAAVDRRAIDGTTALMLASSNGFLDIVRTLILRGADVTASKGGVRARQLALERGYPEIVTLLEQAEALGARLLKAAGEGNDMVVRQLLSSGAPANITDDAGATALMMAARNGDLGMLQALLSRGADATLRDTQGHNVFDWADPSPTTGKYVVAFLADRGISREAAVRAAPAPPQAPQVRASLGMLAAVLARVPPASPSVRTAQRRANAALSRLQALSAKWPADSPQDYRENLSGDVSALESALKGGDVDTLAATVQSVADDLETKLEHCTRSGGNLGGSVSVRVRTVHGGDEIKSWQVFYMPRVFEAAANASPDLFPQLSSPTQETLVPGRYVMWVRDPTTGRVGERTVVKVGEGRTELLLDLPVPAAPAR
jgi:ankyrin repeat protein